MKPVVDVRAALRYAEFMNIASTRLAGVSIIEPERHSDERGWLSELWNPVALQDAGLNASFVQDNLSLSNAVGVVRALHFQIPPFQQGKLITCLTGAIFDVALDLRQGSPTYGEHISVELSSDDGKVIWIPPGFAHGYCSLEPETRVLYKLTAPYQQGATGGVRWDDPELGIDWPVSVHSAVVNERDHGWPTLSEFVSPFEWTG
jgi:dTDP-4-dehydrorhamnose 3,5-epimerase